MASVGFSRRWINAGLKFICLVPFGTGLAHAKCVDIDIASGPLDRALLSLASQTGVDIASTEASLHDTHVKRLEGCLTTAQALARLMRGTGYRAVPLDGGSYRIVRAPVVRDRAPVPAPNTEAPDVVQHIIVTGTKHQVPLLRFPGSVQIVDLKTPTSRGTRNPSLDDVARMTPVMQKTELGVGRNKLFIRGISDSSFNGPSQSTATVYFGEVQLNYSGPQPALNLYDMERIEILEGPQETLYGAGAISGIIRMTPRPADLAGPAVSAAAGVTMTQGGAPGYDASAMVNVPILRDKIGLRFVGYRLRDGGYIDDSLRMASNVNRTDTVGGRASFRFEPGDGWSIYTGLVGQRIEAADANYAETMVGPLSRRAVLAQPYASGIWLARAVVTKAWDSGLRLVSATGLVKTTSNDTFDATRVFLSPVPIFYRVDTDGLLLSHETRLSRNTPNGVSWVAGAAFLYDRSAQNRLIGQPDIPVEIIGVTNITHSASLFGEATLPLSPRLSVMVGARASIAQTQGEPSITPREQPTERGLLLRRVEPAVAVSWLFAPDVAAFARFQSGYRTGGIAVARGIGRVANFRSDSINVAEVGIRKQRSGMRGLALSSALSFARWSDIQADLFSRRSQPYTDNIGGADIVALEASGDWIPTDRLQLVFALLWTKDRTRGLLAGTSPSHNRHLPDTPPFSGNLGVEYHVEKAGGHRFEIGANARYVGRSVLGTGDFLDLSQGNYLVTGLSGAWHWRNLEASLIVDNLTNQTRSQFAMGNPLTFGFREQTVPVRPRSVRLGIAMSW